MKRKRIVRIKRKEVPTVEQLTSTLPPAAVWGFVDRFLDQCKEYEGWWGTVKKRNVRTGVMHEVSKMFHQKPAKFRRFLKHRYEETFNRMPRCKGVSNRFIKGAIARELQFRGFKKEKVLHLLSSKFMTNKEASAIFSKNGMTKSSRSVLELLEKSDQPIQGDGTMAKKTVRKQSAKQAQVFRGIKGRKWGLTCRDTFVKLFKKNVVLRYTEEKIVKWLQAEFPPGNRSKQAYMKDPTKIQAIRTLYNRGGLTGGDVPSRQSLPYDKQGKAMEVTRGRKTGTKKKATKKAQVKATRPTNKKKGKGRVVKIRRRTL